MKKEILLAASALICSMLASCDESNVSSDKEDQYRKITNAYVINTVEATYTELADATIALYDACEAVYAKYEAGQNIAAADIENLGRLWKESRHHWELSEAFLFGPVEDNNIDPHIDTWPHDLSAQLDLMADDQKMALVATKGLSALGDEGLMGYHALEYMIFDVTNYQHPTDIRYNDFNNYSANEMTYFRAVSKDLVEQLVALEACWKGKSNVSSRKQDILNNAPATVQNYTGLASGFAADLLDASGEYTSYRNVMDELLDGCDGIADEVGNTKIGRPVRGAGSNAEEGDRNYIESPYSLNSVRDFTDNIISIRNAYMGSKQGDASLYDYAKQKNTEVANALRDQIETTIAAIEKMQEPFFTTAGDPASKQAVEEAGTRLTEAIAEVKKLL